MRAIIILIQCFFVFNSLQSQTMGQGVKFMSYNIRLDHAGDAENNWHHRKVDMIGYIEEIAPDFMGIQEGMVGQVNYLNQNLPNYDFIGVGRDDGIEAGEFSAIYYRSADWKLVKAETFWLSPTPEKPGLGWDAACIRVCTYGIFEDVSQNQFLVMNTHFDHQGQTARKESLKLINHFVENISADLPVVLMGDFNFDPSAPLYKDLTSHLTDSFTPLKNAGSVSTFNGFKMLAEPDKRIDYILFNKKAALVDYLIDRPKTKNGLQLSDHFPVIVQIKLK